jgi:hypothetical protein
VYIAENRHMRLADNGLDCVPLLVYKISVTQEQSESESESHYG